jgi:putative phage-type endonuclease
MTIAIEPGSAEWQRTITPSKVAAILGVSRWESPYRLWHRMKGLVDPEPPKDIFDAGHDFEPALAAMWKRRNPGWRLSPGEVQIVDDRRGYPAVATLDRRASRGRARRIVEFKTARKLEEWGDFGTDEAPADYVAQVMAQMMFTGYTQHAAHLMVLGPFFEAHTYVIEYDPKVAAVIHERCRAFWASLQSDEPPELDDSVPTYECVRDLHQDINPGETAEVTPELGRYLLDWDNDLRGAERNVRRYKTQLLDKMGSAQYACVGEIQVADRRPHAKGGVALNLTRKNYHRLMAAHPYE